MFCPNCGTNLGNEVRFCRNCGFKIAQGPAPGRQQARQEFINAQAQGGKTKKSSKGGFIALWIILGLIVFICVTGGIAYWLLIGRDMASGDEKPYGGAKIKKQEIWNVDGLKVEATGFYIDEGMGELTGGYRMDNGIKLDIDNGTGKDLTLNCVSLAVNGAAVQGYLDARIGAGEKGKAILKMDNFSLYNMQINTVGEITAELSARDSGTEVYNSGIIRIVTNKSGVSDVPDFRYGGNPVFSDGGISVKTMGYTEVPGLPLSYAVIFQAENSTGSSVRLDFTEINLNGRSFDYTGSAVIQAGTKGTLYVTVPFDDLYEIEKREGDFFPVTEITGNCDISDANTGKLISSIPYSYIE